MPRTNRITCVGCVKQMDGNNQHTCSNQLFRLFLSARCLKKVAVSDHACRKCRWKFDSWMKKTKEDFGDLNSSNTVVKVMVTIDTFDFDEGTITSI